MKHAPDDRSKSRLALSRFARTGLAIAVVVLLGVALLLSNTAGRAGTRAAGAAPPVDVDVTGATLAGPSAVTVTISGVPAYVDHHGTGPTAAGMIIGYWDGNGFGGLIPGDASAQTSDVNEAMVSQESYADYALPLDDGAGILADNSELLPLSLRHVDNCLGDDMKTSQSAYANWYGHTWLTHVGPGVRGYVGRAAGTASYAAATSNLRSLFGTMTWENLVAEIDAGRPLVLLVDETGADDMRFVTAVGYRVLGGTQYYACHNTLDQDLHWYEFRLKAPGLAWSVSDGVTIEMVTLDSHVFLPLVMR